MSTPGATGTGWDIKGRLRLNNFSYLPFTIDSFGRIYVRFTANCLLLAHFFLIMSCSVRVVRGQLWCKFDSLLYAICKA